MRLAGNFSNIVYHLSLFITIGFFLDISGNEPELMYLLKIIPKGLQTDLPQIFIMRITNLIMTVSFIWI